MKKLMQLLKATIVGGVLFLAPFVIVLILLGQAHQLTHEMILPLVERLPFESFIGLEAPRIVAGALLAVICLAAGLFAETSLGGQ